jgi:hypothetical protein
MQTECPTFLLLNKVLNNTEHFPEIRAYSQI